jgi:short subunit dehydrogenase-like uncharacterized protein
VGWRDSHAVPYPPARKGRRVTLPAPFGRRRALNAPFGELLTIPRHLRVTTMDSYLVLRSPQALALRLLSPILPRIAPLAARVTGRFARTPKPDAEEDSRWALVSVAHGVGGRRRVEMSGSNVYRLAARIVTWCAVRTLDGNFTRRGVLGPAQAFDPATALAALKDAGVQYTLYSSPKR